MKNAIEELEAKHAAMAAEIVELGNHLMAVMERAEEIGNQIVALKNEMNPQREDSSGSLKSPAGAFADKCDERSTLLSGHFESGRR